MCTHYIPITPLVSICSINGNVHTVSPSLLQLLVYVLLIAVCTHCILITPSVVSKCPTYCSMQTVFPHHPFSYSYMSYLLQCVDIVPQSPLQLLVYALLITVCRQCPPSPLQLLVYVLLIAVCRYCSPIIPSVISICPTDCSVQTLFPHHSFGY